MITRLPADIELAFAYRELAERVGVITAAFVFTRLWADLAFQSRQHGHSGTYQARFIPHFVRSVTGANLDGCDPIELLLDCGLLKKQENGDYFCDIFHAHNRHLDASYVPDTKTWVKQWYAFYTSVMKNGPAMAHKVPQQAWYCKDGSVIAETVMQSATAFIRTLDIIYGALTSGDRKPRDIEEVGVDTIKAACAIVQRYGDAKIEVVLRRFYAVQQKDILHPCFPTSTEDAIKRWDDLVVMLMPDEGFIPWSARIIAATSDEKEEEPNPEGISRALIDSIDKQLSNLQGREGGSVGS